jgi:hypothetical protein
LPRHPTFFPATFASTDTGEPIGPPFPIWLATVVVSAVVILASLTALFRLRGVLKWIAVTGNLLLGVSCIPPVFWNLHLPHWVVLWATAQLVANAVAIILVLVPSTKVAADA